MVRYILSGLEEKLGAKIILWHSTFNLVNKCGGCTDGIVLSLFTMGKSSDHKKKYATALIFLPRLSNLWSCSSESSQIDIFFRIKLSMTLLRKVACVNVNTNIALRSLQSAARTQSWSCPTAIEEGFIQKKRKRSSLFLGGQNGFNFLLASLCCTRTSWRIGWFAPYFSTRPGANQPTLQIVLMQNS